MSVPPRPANKEDAAPGGLLSKVVRFVRNPTVNWTDLDSIEEDRESQYSKQMLKEMIERKRRNDFVRRREFDQLRKLRQRDTLQGHRVEDPTARTSFFQSSMASPDERAVTLKKIDEIEAQMSQQWWKSKSSGDAPSVLPGAAASPAPAPGAAVPAIEPPARAAGQAAARAPAAAQGPSPASAAFAAAMAATPMGEQAFAPTEPLGLGGVPPLAAPAGLPDAGVGQSTAQLQAVALPEKFVHEPDLEEAAIRFASGDYAGAESGLKEVLVQHQGDDPQQQLEIWMTLFDLYRATGQQEPFDALAIDFAAQYGRSAPLWFSLPEQLGLAGMAPALAADAPPAAPQRELNWNAQPVLTQQSIAALQALLGRSAPPWSLTWTRLTDIEASAVIPLAVLFEGWAEQDVQLNFLGAAALQAVLQAHTQSGDRAADPQWWRLRMAVLRVMGMADEFELVALDYCVTYEVSPPSWAAPRCGYAGDDGAPQPASQDAPDSDMYASGFALSQPGTIDEPPAGMLSGHIEGDAGAQLEPMDEMIRAGQPFNVACDRLIRIDFAAVGSVLNWAAAQQAKGHVIQFTNLHRLVAVLFNVIGVNEHAWIVPRKN